MNNNLLPTVLMVLTIVACSGPKSAEKALVERPSGQGSVSVSVEGVESGQGTIYGAVYLSIEGFPDDKEMAYTYASASASDAVDGTVKLEFPEIPAGWFVVAVFHDEDGDEDLSFNAIGAPKEDYGFSQNPDSVFSAPAFDDAAVYLEPGESKSIVVTIQ